MAARCRSLGYYLEVCEGHSPAFSTHASHRGFKGRRLGRNFSDRITPRHLFMGIETEQSNSTAPEAAQTRAQSAFQNRLTEAKSDIRDLALEFGTIFILESLKEGFQEDIEGEKEGIEMDKSYGDISTADGSTLDSLQAYIVELDATINRCHAIEAQFNPGDKELAAKIDAELNALS